MRWLGGGWEIEDGRGDRGVWMGEWERGMMGEGMREVRREIEDGRMEA